MPLAVSSTRRRSASNQSARREGGAQVMTQYEVFHYTGKQLDIEWDGRLCIHMGECGCVKGELFVAGRKPWCRPDLVSPEDAFDVVKRCPSGALTFIDKSAGITETPVQNNTVQVVYNGPLFLQGDLDIECAAGDMPGVRFRAALCRCGQSKNKPYCDNSHVEVGFSDSGAVGESGDGFEQAGGKLIVRLVEDGPLRLSGSFAIVASSGRLAWRGTEAVLCRCGSSGNKPFCDGSP